MKTAMYLLALKLFIVLIAVSSSVMMIITSQGNEITPVFCLMICITIGIWFISQPINNKKNLSKALGMLEGVPYKAEVFTDKIIISDMSPRENNDIPEENENASEENEETEESSSEDDVPPATVIHLDSPIVNFLDRSDMFILVVNKSYVFIIPKRGFSEEDTVKIREKLSLIMGVRYKAV